MKSKIGCLSVLIFLALGSSPVRACPSQARIAKEILKVRQDSLKTLLGHLQKTERFLKRHCNECPPSFSGKDWSQGLVVLSLNPQSRLARLGEPFPRPSFWEIYFPDGWPSKGGGHGDSGFEGRLPASQELVLNVEKFIDEYRQLHAALAAREAVARGSFAPSERQYSTKDYLNLLLQGLSDQMALVHDEAKELKRLSASIETKCKSADARSR